MVNPNIIIPSVMGGSILGYGIYRMVKGRKKKNMARKPEKGSEEIEEEELEELESKIAKLKSKQSNQSDVPEIEPKEDVRLILPRVVSTEEMLNAIYDTNQKILSFVIPKEE